MAGKGYSRALDTTFAAQAMRLTLELQGRGADDVGMVGDQGQAAAGGAFERR
ncbi:hypothetical protein [Streptomyces cellostaticus]|uniref:hypothetical protein n=1 Tax=Streptomyces cellostaticus TaxID=67285 RepID=UPI000AB274F8|nr:hypothetical protein [Streptomyces cellostaticus]GHI01806.1 hypothetical protein Scel_01270 [Streptomyces cellostaticus]